MAEETNEGVAYLKALKRSVVPSAATAAVPAREPAPEEPPHSIAPAADSGERFQGEDKRRSPRYQCEGSAELRADNCDVRTWASFRDVSLHGCYVEVQATYPVGTPLRMKLEANGFRVETKGNVRVNYPYLGMGIAFVEMSEENRAQLRGLVSTISRPSVVMGPRIASSLPAGGAFAAVPLISDPAAALQALTDFFENRQMLMRDDFLRILRNSQRTGTDR
jgi:PilZ domain-containing protein